jgi:hypothetical protein
MRTILLITLVLFSTINLSAQVIGKIFNKDYANSTFGEVLNSVKIDNASLAAMLSTSGEYIMFNIESGAVRALNSNRESVQGIAVSEEEVFYKMSTSQVYLLLKKGSEKVTKIERRPKTLTLTNGEFTLEMVDPCPPNCY